MKELAKVYGDLLQDRRVQAEQTRYETLTRQRNAALSKYKKSYKAFKELTNGLDQAQAFYTQMKESVDSLMKNVETFVNNRRSEGAQLLSQIERDKAIHASGQEDREREKLKKLMERLSMEPTPSNSAGSASPKPRPHSSTLTTAQQTAKSPVSPQYAQAGMGSSAAMPSPSYPAFPPNGRAPSVDPYSGAHQPYHLPGAPAPVPIVSSPEAYNPMAYFYQPQVSPPPNQQYFNPAHLPYGGAYPTSPPPGQQPGPPPLPSHTPQYHVPTGYVPPPPPPRPSTMTYPAAGGQYPSMYPPAGRPPQGAGHQASQSGSQSAQGSQNDPWAGLHVWSKGS
jgi:hypothetical protein